MIVLGFLIHFKFALHAHKVTVIIISKNVIKLLWLTLGVLLVVILLSWQQSIHAGPFTHFPDSHPEFTDDVSMKLANEDLAEKITKLAKPETITPYLQAMGFACISKFGGPKVRPTAGADEISYHSC